MGPATTGGGAVGPARVLIVDDEASARRQIRHFLAGHPGITIVGEARDGEEAVAVFGQTKPDMVLLDIRMPRMDGLAAARLIHKQAPETYIVFLTAYPEFEYAQQAVRLGATDYVLKPVRREELRTVLRRVLASRGRRAVRQARMRESGDAFRALMPFMRRDYLNILITRPSLLDRDELEGQTRALGLVAPPKLIVVADHADEDGLTPREVGSWGADLVQWSGGTALTWREGERLIIAPSPRPGEPEGLEKWAARAVAWVRESLGARARVAAGDPCRDINDLPACYRQALVRLGRGGRRPATALLRLESDLCTAALRGDLPRVARLAGDILGDLREEETAIEARVLAGLIAAAFVRGGLPAETVAELREEFEGLLARKPGPAGPDTTAVIAGLVEELGRRLADSASVGERAVLAAKAYVEAHYSESLSLRRVATAVYLSPYYFSRLFKSHTGMTLGEYVTEVRLARACDLLRSTDQTVHKVAQAVGYGSGSYFSSVFTRRFGVSPGQYRLKREA